MPEDAVEISAEVMEYPPDDVSYGMPLVVGYKDGSDSTIKKASTYDEVESKFGTDSNIQEDLKGVLDEGAGPVYGFEADMNVNNGDTWPDDFETDTESDTLKTQIDSYDEIETILFSEVDLSDNSGTIDTLVDIAELKQLIMTGAIETSDVSTDVDGALTDISETKNLFGVVHNYDSDSKVDGRFLGALTTINPREKVMWKSISSLKPESFYTSDEISTIENENVNAVIPKGEEAVFSSGQSYTDVDLFRWIDSVRAKYYIRNQLKSNLEKLIRTTRVPYTSKGFTKVKNSLKSVCRELESANLIDYHKVSMPSFSELTPSDRESRVLKDVKVTMRFVGHIQEVTIDLKINF